MKLTPTVAVAVLACSFVLGSCATEKTLEIVKVLEGSPRYQTLYVESPSIRKSRLEEPNFNAISVYLPPSYPTSDKRYPVIYLLPGYGETADMLLPMFAHDFDSLFAGGREPEFIIVGITGVNALGGSFYVNSPATGNWEDYVVKEVVVAVDSRFRTIPVRESRGIAGFSMGGFGAFNLGLGHPDLYAAAFALCPSLFDENGLRNAIPTWDVTPLFKVAYGAAFAPDLTIGPPYAKVPAFDGSSSDNLIVASWEAGFGDVESKVAAYAKQERKLTMLRIQYGTRDMYKWIPEGCIYASKALERYSLPYELVGFDGGHSFTSQIATGSIIPFFARYLRTK